MRKSAPFFLSLLFCLGLCACTAASTSEPSALQASDDAADLSHYLPADDLPPYEPIPITQQRYEGEFCSIDFMDLPENDAETLVCDEYYSWVMGEGARLAALWQPGPSAPPLRKDYIPTREDFEWIRVDRVVDLDVRDVAALPEEFLLTLFQHYHEAYGGGLGYEDYVAAVMEAGCRVVAADYETKYTEEKNAAIPQIPDGAHTEYWLLVPGEDGNLRLYENTRFFTFFMLPPLEELVPPILIQS